MGTIKFYRLRQLHLACNGTETVKHFMIPEIYNIGITFEVWGGGGKSVTEIYYRYSLKLPLNNTCVK